MRVGVDLVDVAEFERRFDGRAGELEAVFTRSELDYARERKRPWEHLAARFAAKEAALKALGSGLAGAMTWREVEVTRDEGGAPGLVFHGAAAEALTRQRLRATSVSLAHTDAHAVAVVLLVSV